MWDPKKYMTKHQYLEEHTDYFVRELFEGEGRPEAFGDIYLPLWWTEKEVRIFWESGVTAPVVTLVRDAIESQINEIGCLHPVSVELFGDHPSAVEVIEDCTASDGIDYERLSQYCISEAWRNPGQGGRQHADVFISTKPFTGDSGSWGYATFSHGIIILALYGQRQSLDYRDFLKQVVIHEAGHLLGFTTHCDTYQNVEGYHYSGNCNMHYNSSSVTICDKCIDYIRHFWLQVYDRYG